ncbi:DUF4149 domain-containing protein [Candidatus Uabimicrobium amorphum]|uniref:DUF4149 domain-containing protein n=1 Tax=Uabimicrobium amorphum TaxID=2596890 RepID=A0A5S9ITM4_UABAM|nr:DUF4149 domain-containing protein [Candidatus Uabimicrobium amorphum]BBM87406.1 hypothetical protein UABAM_05815 [Candidatus Uabimicrobium amorphum]
MKNAWLNRLYYGSLGMWFGAVVAEVLSAISIFRMSRQYKASPGVEPFNDPAFSEYSSDIVAGFIANKMFNMMHVVELVCFVLVIAAVIGLAKSGAKIKKLPIVLIVFAGLSILFTYAWISPEMSALKETMYNPAAEEAARAAARSGFDSYHKITEKLISMAGLAVLIALNLGNAKQQDS